MTTRWPLASPHYALWRRWQDLDLEISSHDEIIEELTQQAADA
ncbi:hypothetical protein [Conexibacter sp. DBS9H8]|nr:hypothetical protein [Conexibacter sp. DBS9H8]